ncbi:MAG: hypothetical protein CL912_02275 [Deltaproteobacteria bacterium]|nr:hypothetical protein [Deltaproteobacteria bacterium]
MDPLISMQNEQQQYYDAELLGSYDLRIQSYSNLHLPEHISSINMPIVLALLLLTFLKDALARSVSEAHAAQRPGLEICSRLRI